MSFITVVILIFSVIGAIDNLLGNKLGMGEEFEKAFMLFCPMVLSMLGILVISPALGVWCTPAFTWFFEHFGIDPSIIPASLFANDMGGMTLARAVCKTQEIGSYNAFIVSSMMGCVVSFTIPFSFGIVKKDQQRELLFGLLCGIITIPSGCIVSGIMCRLSARDILMNLLPLIIFSVLIGMALIMFPNACIKAFSIFGLVVKTIAIIGFVCAVCTFLTNKEISPYFDTLENAAAVCVNACITLSGALPFMYAVSKLLSRKMHLLGSQIGIDSVSAVAFLSTLVTNAATFGIMDKMNSKGVVLNSAFAVSGAFVFGSHLAFTMAFDNNYTIPMIVGKIISGVCAVLLALVLYKENPTNKRTF